jgi:hypothetical protein
MLSTVNRLDDVDHAVVVVQQSKAARSSSWWYVLKQVVFSSAGWSLLGILAVFMVFFLDEDDTPDDDTDDHSRLIRLLFHAVTIGTLAPLGALFGLIGATRQLLLQKDGPVARELDRRIMSFNSKKKKKKTTSSAGSETMEGEEEEETEEEQAARNLPLIFNSLTFRSGFWCFQIIVGFFLPSSKLLFERINLFRKKTSKTDDGVPRTSAILVEFCDSYIQQWQYRLAMVGALFYGLCVLCGILLLRII